MYSSMIKKCNRRIIWRINEMIKNKFICMLIFIVSSFFTSFTHASDKILRVGTTGDYPPFSEYNQKLNQFSGFDIDMANALGNYLGVKIVFVKTTWPTLSQDLAENKFDIAMSGISENHERKKMFLLSEPILQDGKIPLVRCSDVRKYMTLKQVNNPSVRVVENKGGTNLQFVTKFLKKPKLLTVDKNELTIDYLLQNKADVMITDRIEAIYRQKNITGLCVVDVKNLLTKQNKIYLINKNDVNLLKQVNRWLYDLKKSGRLSLMIKQLNLP